MNLEHQGGHCGQVWFRKLKETELVACGKFFPAFRIQECVGHQLPFHLGVIRHREFLRVKTESSSASLNFIVTAVFGKRREVIPFLL